MTTLLKEYLNLWMEVPCVVTMLISLATISIVMVVIFFLICQLTSRERMLKGSRELMDVIPSQ